jgi:hypothetical protein
MNRIGDGITQDLTNPAGTFAEWWSYNATASVTDDVYDVEPIGPGRVWNGPAPLHVVRASIAQGTTHVTQRGYYNADTLHLTLNVDDLRVVSPEFFTTKGRVRARVSDANRFRIVWHEQVYRPIKTQQMGMVQDRNALVILECIQVMPDELVNDAQFLQYAQV